MLHISLHAAIGCGIGAAVSDNCGAGAAGAASGELMAEWTNNATIGKLSGAITGALTDTGAEGVYLGYDTASNSIENNWLTKGQVYEKEKRLAAAGCNENPTSDMCNGIRAEYRNLSFLMDSGTDAILTIATFGLSELYFAVRGGRLVAVAGDEIAGGAQSAVSSAKLNSQLAGEEISGGHAFSKHINEFADLGIKTKDQLAKHIDNVITNADDIRYAKDGKQFFLDFNTKTVVVRNPSAVDGGTVFRPDYSIGWDKYISDYVPKRNIPY